MRAVDIIRNKRDSQALSLAEIEAFVSGATSRSWPDYQVSALLMAIVLSGMTAEETAWLTGAMVRSGVRLDLSDIPGAKVDKHSTGGVGDKTSLILAPLAAACGVVVPMMSGRGLGHTGGTLDKLESIPGFRVGLTLEEFREALLTAMDTPLGRAVGNSLEVIECLETLKGRGPTDLEALSVTLAARMLRLGGAAKTDQEGETKIRDALTSGRGLEKFRDIIAQQGGDARVVDDYSRLPSAPQRTTFTAAHSGYVTGLDAELVGRATMVLGAGRDRVEDVIDPAVGAKLMAKTGDPVRAGDVVAELVYPDPARFDPALDRLPRPCRVRDEPPPNHELL